MLNLEECLQTRLGGWVKGVPAMAFPLQLREVADAGWSVLHEDLPLPLLVLRRTALENNLDVMARYCRRHHVEHAPHGKTTMAPQLFDMQLERGAWGLTAATTEQLQVYRKFGIQQVLMANQIVGRPNLRYVATELAQDERFNLITWVDSAPSVTMLAAAATEHGLQRPWQVMVEVGYAGGRSGTRDDEDLADVLRAIKLTRGQVELVGVAAFEGLLATERFGGTGEANGGDTSQRGFLMKVRDVAIRLADSGALPDRYLLSAGGSTSFDVVIEAFNMPPPPGARVMLRSGCYITHDHYMNAVTSPLSKGNSPEADVAGSLEPALELWTYAHSTPEAGLALLTAGRRDAPYDYGLPIPLRRYPRGEVEPRPLGGARIRGLNDQHAYLEHAGDVKVGDRVVLGISHPCTAFEKWRFIPIVDDDYQVVHAILTYF